MQGLTAAELLVPGHSWVDCCFGSVVLDIWGCFGGFLLFRVGADEEVPVVRTGSFLLKLLLLGSL